MAKFSTGLRNYVQATGPVRQALANSVIRLYSGAVPASADSALGGGNVLLCEITDEAGSFNFDTVASGGALTKQPDALLEGEVLASGVATFYRHVLPADVGAASTAAIRIQGTVGLAGTDMELSSTTLVAGASQRLSSHTVVLLEE
jgi:hypothetical protein